MVVRIHLGQFWRDMDHNTATSSDLEREAVESVVIRFAGDSGDGMQITGAQFTQETALFGNDLATFPDFPAEIRAPVGTTFGVSAFQIHFGSHEVRTSGDAPDVLVAMNPAALKVSLEDLHVVIRFAGDSGDGMQITGAQFTQETALFGNDLATFPDFPAEIRAPVGTTFGVSTGGSNPPGPILERTWIITPLHQAIWNEKPLNRSSSGSPATPVTACRSPARSSPKRQPFSATTWPHSQISPPRYVHPSARRSAFRRVVRIHRGQFWRGHGS